jgi:glycine/D-amino acid oxidase-like deaminating enzyme
LGEAPKVDVLIVGGGVAGLWTRARLELAGYSTRLISVGGLGAGQTVASQGILHRGVKYSFSLAASAASRELELAGAAWDDAMAGRGGPDLTGLAMLSRWTYLWTRETFLGGLTGSLGAMAMKSMVRRVDGAERPEVFAGAAGSVGVWRAEEPVVDPGSLCGLLARSGVGEIVEVAGIGGNDLDGWMRSASAVVFAAGVGNEGLLRSIGADVETLCQRRPLQMVMARGAGFDLFGHCVKELSDKPRLTVTTGKVGAERVWYIGGNVAERGAGEEASRVIEEAKRELGACMPWIDTGGWAWDTLNIDRAEGRTAEGKRPDGPVVVDVGRAIAVWPTKLALAPVAAEKVLGLLVSRGVIGTRIEDGRSLGRALVAETPWERASWR